MARSLCQTIIRTKPTPSSSCVLSFRSQSNQPDPLLRKLEDAIHRIIVRRSAPDWLRFLPGSSYWVPPSTARSYGLAQVVEKLASEELISTTTTVRGWPSSHYFIKAGSPHPVEVDITSNTKSKSKEEEEEEEEEG